VLRISPFGLIEMTRQRIRPSLRRNIYKDCPCCSGTGQVKTSESMSIEVMRILMAAANLDEVRRIVVTIPEDVANHLNNRKRKEITDLEERSQVTVNVNVRTDVGPEHLEVRCTNEIGADVQIPAVVASKSKF
jgi:ribonuclease E